MSSITSGTVPRTAASRVVMSRMAGIVFDPKEKRMSAGAAAKAASSTVSKVRIGMSSSRSVLALPSSRASYHDLDCGASVGVSGGPVSGQGSSAQQRRVGTGPVVGVRSEMLGGTRCASAAGARQPPGPSGGTRARRRGRGGPPRGVAAPVGG